MAASPQVRSIKADLKCMGKKVLLVEGPDDWHAFSHLIHISTGAFPAYELGHCDNDDGVLDILSGMTEASSQTQSVLGAVLDADQGKEKTDGDSGIQARIRSLRAFLLKVYSMYGDAPRTCYGA